MAREQRISLGPPKSTGGQAEFPKGPRPPVRGRKACWIELESSQTPLSPTVSLPSSLSSFLSDYTLFPVLSLHIYTWSSLTYGTRRPTWPAQPVISSRDSGGVFAADSRRSPGPAICSDSFWVRSEGKIAKTTRVPNCAVGWAAAGNRKQQTALN